MFDQIKGVIFDMDGTLVDSMGVWRKIDEDFILKKRLNILPEVLMERISHLSFNETAEYFKREFQLPESVEEIKADWNCQAKYEYVHHVPLKEYAFELLDTLKSKGIKLALATSSSGEILHETLHARGIHHFFDVLVTTDMAGKTKVEPDVYLLAAKLLELDPQEIAVFEDIPAAMAGARKAGMTVFGVYDSFSADKREEILSTCHIFIHNFSQILHMIS